MTEMSLRRCGPQSRVDADEQEPRLGPYQIRDRSISKRLEFGPRERGGYFF